MLSCVVTERCWKFRAFHTVAASSTNIAQRSYEPVDGADRTSCRPDFAVAHYAGHLAVAERDFVLNPDIRVTSDTPPAFLLQAEDDPLDPVENSLLYFPALQKAPVWAEPHVYGKGALAFGLRSTESTITRWPKLLQAWLRVIGYRPRNKPHLAANPALQ